MPDRRAGRPSPYASPVRMLPASITAFSIQRPSGQSGAATQRRRASCGGSRTTGAGLSASAFTTSSVRSPSARAAEAGPTARIYLPHPPAHPRRRLLLLAQCSEHGRVCLRGQPDRPQPRVRIGLAQRGDQQRPPAAIGAVDHDQRAGLRRSGAGPRHRGRTNGGPVGPARGQRRPGGSARDRSRPAPPGEPGPRGSAGSAIRPRSSRRQLSASLAAWSPPGAEAAARMGAAATAVGAMAGAAVGEDWRHNGCSRRHGRRRCRRAAGSAGPRAGSASESASTPGRRRRGQCARDRGPHAAELARGLPVEPEEMRRSLPRQPPRQSPRPSRPPGRNA